MPETVTVATGLTVALCACCAKHGPEPGRPLTWEIVTCPECGAACSCEGCIADVDTAQQTGEPR